MIVLRFGKRLGLALAACLAFATASAAEEDVVDIVRCLKAAETVDSYSRDILFSACITAVERYCMAPIRRTERQACVEGQTASLTAFNDRLAVRVPQTPPEGLSGFRMRSYERTWERVRDGKTMTREGQQSCDIFPGACAFLAELTRTSDVLRLARQSGTDLTAP